MPQKTRLDALRERFWNERSKRGISIASVNPALGLRFGFYCTFRSITTQTPYTADDITRLLADVDRANPKGRRDYAMLLLAARLGLRASDICRLIFDSFH